MINESLEIHPILNPKLWIGYTLKPQIAQKILDIVNEFVQYIELPIDVLDIHLVGSNASYNYSSTSDLDIHVITDFSLMDASSEILQALYNAKKRQFNDEYDITIKGINAELYVEDVRSTAVSNGVYSVLTSTWIKYPEKITPVKYDTTDEVDRWISQIDSAIDNDNVDRLKELYNRLYLLRRNSLSTGGEFSKGNQVFKDIRSSGYLDKLRSSIIRLTSQELSLEKLIRYK